MGKPGKRANRSILRAAMAGMLALSGIAAARAAILVNGSFETGDFTGWTVANVNGGLSGVLADNVVIPGVDFYKQNVRTGDYGAYATVAASPYDPFPTNPLPPRYLSLSQEVTLGAGIYEASFYLGNHNISGASFGTLNAINKDLLAIFVDGAPLEFFDPVQVVAADHTPAGFFRYDADFETTAGQHTVEFRISGSAVTIVGISVDDFAITEVNVQRVPRSPPIFGGDRDLSDLEVSEPASLLLAASGLLGLAWSRRRG